MEKKHFEEFIDLFGALTDAGIIISGKYKKELEDFLLSAIERRLIQLENLDLCLPEGLMEEIEKNFYDHKDDRETYLIRIIRYFKDISPFLCIEFHKEYVAASIGRNGLKIGNRVYLENHVSTHKTVEKYCHWITPHLEIDTATNTEKYVILCYEAYQSFFKLLDPLCIDFGLDLPEIQNRINIQVWKRNEIMLRCMDYYLTPKQQEKTQLETKPTFEPKIEVLETTEASKLELKPIFKPEAIDTIFEIIKDYFKAEQQTELLSILKTGNKASNKLLFMGNGNRLTDTFKQLIEYDFITCCEKKDLINWTCLNFSFLRRGEIKPFIHGTVEKTISGNNFCKSHLIEIKDGKIQKIDTPRTKQYIKN